MATIYKLTWRKEQGGRWRKKYKRKEYYFPCLPNEDKDVSYFRCLKEWEKKKSEIDNEFCDRSCTIDNDMLMVCKPGTKVVLAGEISATVNQVAIKANNLVTYLCVWWNGNERKEVWVESYEIMYQPEQLTVMTIGSRPQHEREFMVSTEEWFRENPPPTKKHCKPKPLCQCIQRKCMKCQTVFNSVGQRICDVCTGKNRKVGLLSGKDKPRSHRGKVGAE